ncbi:MAG: hypothetical protein HQL50_00420 [Magnetococcales bacterium]|nr:hypothetical protein [Magnetococcales bacterium]
MNADALQLGFCRRPATRTALRRFIADHWKSDVCQAMSDQAEVFVNALTSSAKKGEVVLFVAVHRGNFPSIEYVAHGLSQSGIATHALYLHSDPPQQVYDHALTLDSSLALLWQIAQRLSALPVYLQCHAKWIFLNAFLTEANPKLRIRHEIFDWMAPFIGDQLDLFEQEGVFSREEMHWMLDGEEQVRAASDGLFHKSDGPWVEEHVKKAEAPDLCVMPCPPKSWFRESRTPAPIPPEGPFRLVYPGQIKPPGEQRRIFGVMNFLPMIQSFGRQGVDFSIHHPIYYSPSESQRVFADYHREADGNPHFKFLPGVPLPDLLDHLVGRYHLGLVANFFDDDFAVGWSHTEECMSSKLFVYLAAGLPVLVSEEYRFMARFVQEREIGVVVSRSELENLVPVLERIDWSALSTRVIEARSDLHVDANTPKILDFMGVGEQP